MQNSSNIYFRQLLSGRDFAVGNRAAEQMVNFVYLLGDRETGECVVIDPAYAVDDIVAVADADGMKISGVLATHYHADHIGGSIMGLRIEGIAKMLESASIPIHVNAHESEFVMKTTGITKADLVEHQGGDTLAVGNMEVTFIHTPGHTPGSQCFLANGCLVSGDTLFLDGCGRTDLPGSNPEDMYDSLQRLAQLPDHTVVYPGHQYSVPSSSPMENVRQANYVYRTRNKEAWMQWFGGVEN